MSRMHTSEVLDYHNQATAATNVVIPVQYKEMLRFLSNKTRIRQSEYIREALRDVLIKYRKEFVGSSFEF